MPKLTMPFGAHSFDKSPNNNIPKYVVSLSLEENCDVSTDKIKIIKKRIKKIENHILKLLKSNKVITSFCDESIEDIWVHTIKTVENYADTIKVNIYPDRVLLKPNIVVYDSNDNSEKNIQYDNIETLLSEKINIIPTIHFSHIWIMKNKIGMTLKIVECLREEYLHVSLGNILFADV